MQINVGLMVATVDFLRSIDGKEIVLSSEIKNDNVFLLIYPKESIYVGAIDDIFEDCEYDIAYGGVDLEFGFDDKHPFKYEIGMQINDSSPFIPRTDLMFDLINKALIHKGLLDEDNEDDIVFTKECYYGIRDVQAIVHINDESIIGIEDVEIIDPTGKDEFIDWINNQHELVIQKLRNNANTWQQLLDDLKSKQAILCPSSAFELAQVKFEYDETKKSLWKYQKENLLDVPKDALKTLNQLVDGGIVMLNEIIEVDFNNGGNLGVFIESMEKGIEIDIEMVNINDKMIEIDFHDYKDSNV